MWRTLTQTVLILTWFIPWVKVTRACKTKERVEEKTWAPNLNVLHSDTNKLPSPSMHNKEFNNVHVYSSLMGVFIPLHHIPTPCNKNRIVQFFFFGGGGLTPEMKTTKKKSPVWECFSFFVLGTPLIYYQPPSSCNNTILKLRLHVVYHIWSLWGETLLRGRVPRNLDMKMVAFTEFFFLTRPLFPKSSSFLPHRHSSDARHLPP